MCATHNCDPQVYAPKPSSLAAVKAAVAAVEGTDLREGDVLVARVVQVRCGSMIIKGEGEGWGRGDGRIGGMIREVACLQDALCAHERCTMHARSFQAVRQPSLSPSSPSLQVLDWGAVVSLPNNTRHILHVSEVAHGKVDLSRELREGEEVPVKVLGRDLRGLIRLSRKALLPPPQPAQQQGSAAGKAPGAPQQKGR